MIKISTCATCLNTAALLINSRALLSKKGMDFLGALGIWRSLAAGDARNSEGAGRQEAVQLETARLLNLAVSIQLGVPFVGVVITRALLSWVYIRAPDFWNILPCLFARTHFGMPPGSAWLLLCLEIFDSISLCLSLSLPTYVYIYMYIYTHIHTFRGESNMG